MIRIKHKFLNYEISTETEVLVIGTFNPDTANNNAEFFYSRNRNFLWRLLPTAYNEGDLKKGTIMNKIDFINQHKIDFIDLILEIEVEEGQETNYYDGYIDNKVKKWTDVISEISKLKNLKKVCFTRKTFSDIPNMRERIDMIMEFCQKQNITFYLMTTPARFYSDDKQKEWISFLINIP